MSQIPIRVNRVTLLRWRGFFYCILRWIGGGGITKKVKGNTMDNVMIKEKTKIYTHVLSKFIHITIREMCLPNVAKRLKKGNPRQTCEVKVYLVFNCFVKASFIRTIN